MGPNFKKLCEASPDGLCLLDKKGIFVWANQALERLLGWPPHTLTGCSYLEVLDPTEEMDLRKVGVALLRKGTLEGLPIRLRRADGSSIALHGQVSWDAEAQQAFASLRPQFQVSNWSEEEKKRLRQVERMARIGYWEASMQPSKTYWSPGLFELLEVEQTHEASSWDLETFMTEEERTRIQPFIDRAIEQGEPATYFNQLISGKGKPLSLMQRIEPLHDKNGQLTALRGICQDISAQIKAEAGRRSSEDRLQTILEQIDDLIISIDPEGTILYLNRTFEYHTPPTQFIGKKLVDFLKPEHPAGLEAEIRRAFEGQANRRFVVNRTLQGRQLYLACSLRPHKLPQGMPHEATLVVKDLTHPLQTQLKADALITAMPDLMLVLDRDGVFLDYHAPSHGLLSMPQEKFLGRSIYEIWGPELVEEHLGPGHRAMDTGQPQQYEYQLETLAQGLRYFEARVQPISDDRALYVVRDITEEKNLERHLRENRHQLALAIKGGNLGMWDINFRTGWVKCNERWFTMLGLEAPSPCGFWVDEFWGDRLHPEDLAHTQQALDACIAGDTPVYQATFRLRASDGTWRWIMSRGEIVAWDDQGHPSRGVGTHVDVSEQKLQEARLRELLRNFPNGSVNVFDREFRYQFADGQGLEMVGLTSEELIGTKLQDIFPPEQFALVRPHYERAFEGEEVGFELPVGDYTFHLTAAPLYQAQQQVEAIVVVARDITLQKQAEEQLRELNQNLEKEVALRTQELLDSNRSLQAVNEELASFSYSVSHDLRAPLRAIVGFGKILLSEHAEHLSGEGQELLQAVVRNAQKMGTLIDGILSYSRLSRQERDTEPLHLHEIFQEVAQELSLTFDLTCLQLKMDDLPAVVGDPLMVRQAIYNLLSNAVKYSSKEPQPRIEVGGKLQAPGLLRCWVKDNGVGFQQKYADKIFGVFQRLHKVSEFEGTGVGMAIAKRIITQHGGEIWAEGTPGQGATFYFTLPLVKQPGDQSRNISNS